MIGTLYSSIEDWYRTAWALKYHHNYSYTEVNEMMPFERDLFVELIIAQKEEERKESM